MIDNQIDIGDSVIDQYLINKCSITMIKSYINNVCSNTDAR